MTSITFLGALLLGCNALVPVPDPKETDIGDVPASEQCNRLTCATCAATDGCGWCLDESGRGQCLGGNQRQSVEAVCRGQWINDLLECPDPGVGSGSECTDTPDALLSQTEIARTDTVVVYKQQYLSEGLKIFGQLCVPTSPGPHPIALFNHGGFDGLGADIGPKGFCSGLAAAGFVVVMSQYRGQLDRGFGVSEGEMEFCSGEVTDSLNLLEITQQRCDVDPHHVIVLGGSHGGCNTLQAVRRMPPGTFDAAAAFFPPTDLVEMYNYFYRERLNLNPFIAITSIYFFGIINDIMGGPPASDLEAYAVRSPVNFAEEIAGRGVPLLLMHGLADFVVPYGHSTQMHEALVDNGMQFTNFHLKATARWAPQVATSKEPVRGHEDLTYEAEFPETPDEFVRAGNMFMLVDAHGHEMPSGALMNVTTDFLTAHVETSQQAR